MWNETGVFVLLAFVLSGITFYITSKIFPKCNSNMCRLIRPFIIISSAIIFARIIAGAIV